MVNSSTLPTVESYAHFRCFKECKDCYSEPCSVISEQKLHEQISAKLLHTHTHNDLIYALKKASEVEITSTTATATPPTKILKRIPARKQQNTQRPAFINNWSELMYANRKQQIQMPHRKSYTSASSGCKWTQKSLSFAFELFALAYFVVVYPEYINWRRYASNEYGLHSVKTNGNQASRQYLYSSTMRLHAIIVIIINFSMECVSSGKTPNSFVL